eukprot:6259353-Amphidinium_carterae.1
MHRLPWHLLQVPLLALHQRSGRPSHLLNTLANDPSEQHRTTEQTRAIVEAFRATALEHVPAPSPQGYGH